jgi:hypothetical protein
MSHTIQTRIRCTKSSAGRPTRRAAVPTTGSHTRPRLHPAEALEFFAYLTLLTNGALVFTDNAVVAWRKARFRSVQRMEDDLLRLAVTVNDLQAGRPHGIFAAARQRGLTFAPTDTTLRRRTTRFTYQGQVLSREAHIKTGDCTSPDMCGRIYGSFTPTLVVIDHVGRHL